VQTQLSFDEKFEEMETFFLEKGLRITGHWKTLWHDAHARAFTVANVTKLEILDDIKKALDIAMASGQTAAAFKKGLSEILERKGWFAPKGEKAIVEMPDGSFRKRLTGWRLDTIFRTNLNCAYHVGRFQQQEEVKKALPYRQLLAVRDIKTRPTHLEQHGKTYPVDHPYWDYWYPPNGFGCRCTTRLLSNAMMKAYGIKPLTEWNLSNGYPDEGFDYHPGKAGLRKFPDDYTQKAKKAEKLFRQNAIPSGNKIEKTGVEPTPRKINIEDIVNSENILKHLNLDETIDRLRIRYKKIDDPNHKGLMGTNTVTGKIYIFDKDNYEFNPYKTIIKAINKKTNLSFHEEYSLEALWHEIMHNRQKHTVVFADGSMMERGSLKHNFMETINQWISRRSYDLLLKEMDIKQNWLEQVKTKGPGYGIYVKEFDKVLKSLKINETEFQKFIWEMHGTKETGDYFEIVSDYLHQKSGKDLHEIVATLDILYDDRKLNYDAYEIIEKWGGPKAKTFEDLMRKMDQDLKEKYDARKK